MTQNLNKPIKCLICCCCGETTKGRQWFNRDTGYGLCPKCAIFIEQKDGIEEVTQLAGVKGIHYNLEPICSE